MRDFLTGFLAGVFVMILVSFLLLITAAARAQSEHEGHSEYHQYYKTWKQPGNQLSCCNAREYVNGQHVGGDCAPTEAELRNGHWWARLPKEEIGKWGNNGEEWIEVPDSRIIHQVNPSPMRAHLCYDYGRVLCFVPPFGGG